MLIVCQTEPKSKLLWNLNANLDILATSKFSESHRSSINQKDVFSKLRNGDFFRFITHLIRIPNIIFANNAINNSQLSATHSIHVIDCAVAVKDILD